MAITMERNSLHYLAGFSPIRCDTHFKHNMKLADSFFSNQRIDWVALGSALEGMRNGMNLNTSFYSMEPTDTLYISVSQVKEYGLTDKNQNYLTDEVKDLDNFAELEPDMILVTRSGTVGVALSTNHPSFDFDNLSYVASGFIVTAHVKTGLSADIIAGYINLLSVQRYLTAMAAGACQKNLAQPALLTLPVPEAVLRNPSEFAHRFETYKTASIDLLAAILQQESQLAQLKSTLSQEVESLIACLYA